ncbi:DUF6438 domain-containing protein [Labilibaculum sp. DW002]|uniref:DUF6438 domain-containing protein n=1 Tax=Paralabilibaculum antarcticum TaxID=2912572 RepID=A0ABT5VW76_9BACT|nr:DUF6438 domain-containing protein [Labilibaculum sp. DW002]MDE5419566.1 DUF6438 domain-containing protein [Labilibaculum sp. DW002]
MKYTSIILILIFIIGCSTKELIDKSFNTKYWNLCVNEKDSSLVEYKDQALHFGNSVVYFYNKKIANYSISNDTLIICDTSYYDKWIIDNGIRSKAKVDISFHKFIKNDSLYSVTYKYLIGKILKANSDSLIIDKIEGYGFPFKYQDKYKFYNDTLLYDLNLTIDTIEFSSSLCYGNCPAIAIKIDKGLNFNFWGGKYADKQGFYKGEITQLQFDKFENLIRIANIENNDSEFCPPIDAPYVELIIDYNKNKTKRFWGYWRDFPARVKNVGSEMFNLYKTSSLDSCGYELTFEVELDIPEKRVAPPPPPPEILKVLKEASNDDIEINYVP